MSSRAKVYLVRGPPLLIKTATDSSGTVATGALEFKLFFFG